MPCQLGEGEPPAKRQGKGGPRPQDGGPVQQEVFAPALAQGAEAGKHHRGRQHHGHQRRLPDRRAVLTAGRGVESRHGSPLLAGPAPRLSHQIWGLVVCGGHAEGIPQPPALPGAAPHGKHHGKAPHRGIAGNRAALRQQQARHTVRRHHDQGDHRQQVAGAAPPGQLCEGPGEHLPAQERNRRQAGQQHAALDGGVPGPVGDLIAIGLHRHGDHRQQRHHRRRKDRPPAPLGLGPALRRRLSHRRLRPDGVNLRRFLGLRLRRRIELLRLHQRLPGEQAAAGPQQGLLNGLLHHRVHRTAHHILQRDGLGRPGQLLPQVRLLRLLLRRGHLLRRRPSGVFFHRVRGRGRPSLFGWPALFPRDGRSRLRGGGNFLQGLLLHGLHQPLLPAAAVFRQDLLQGVVLLRRRDIRPCQIAIKISLAFGSHAVSFFLSALLSLFSPAAGAPLRKAGSPPRRRRSGNSASPAWGCLPENRNSPLPGGSYRPPRCR